MIARLRSENGAAPNPAEEYAFQTALRELRPIASPTDALNARVRTLADQAAQRLVRYRQNMRIARFALNVGIIAIGTASAPRLWTHYQLFQAMRRLATVACVRAVTTRANVPGGDRSELTLSGYDALLRSKRLTVTRRGDEIRYSYGGSTPSIVSQPTFSGWYGKEKEVTDSLNLKVLFALRQAALPFPLHEDDYRLSRQEYAGMHLRSAVLENRHGERLTIAFDPVSDLPTKVIAETGVYKFQAAVDTTTLSYPAPFAAGWMFSAWPLDGPRIRNARRLAILEYLGNRQSSGTRSFFQQDNDVFMVSTSSLHPGFSPPTDHIEWRLTVDNVPFALINAPETHLVMPDEAGRKRPLRINGRPVEVLWFTPLAAFSRKGPYDTHEYTLKGYVSSDEGKKPFFSGTGRGQAVVDQVPTQFTEMNWPQPLLGASFIGGSQAQIDRLREQARQAYRDKHN